jgi:hypothetical protein
VHVLTISNVCQCALWYCVQTILILFGISVMMTLSCVESLLTRRWKFICSSCYHSCMIPFFIAWMHQPFHLHGCVDSLGICTRLASAWWHILCTLSSFIFIIPFLLIYISIVSFFSMNIQLWYQKCILSNLFCFCTFSSAYFILFLLFL